MGDCASAFGYAFAVIFQEDTPVQKIKGMLNQNHELNWWFIPALEGRISKPRLILILEFPYK